jgi:hypothetical protein
MNISLVKAELYHEDGQTDMRKLRVTFRNFANTHINFMFARPNIVRD